MLWTRAVFWLLLVVGFCLGVTSVWWGYSYGFLFLLLPLMFRVFRRPPIAVAMRCSQCDYQSTEAGEEFCPRDGSPLTGGSR